MVKGAYMFVWPDADSKRHRAVVETSTLSWIIVGVKDFDEGVDVAKRFVEEGVQLIELCGAWGAVVWAWLQPFQALLRYAHLHLDGMISPSRVLVLSPHPDDVTLRKSRFAIRGNSCTSNW